MATLNLVERLGSGSAVLVSIAITVRVLPSLLMFPAAGVVADRRVSAPHTLLKPKLDVHFNNESAAAVGLSMADVRGRMIGRSTPVCCRFNRVAVLTATNLASAATVLFFPLVQTPTTLW